MVEMAACDRQAFGVGPISDEHQVELGKSLFFALERYDPSLDVPLTVDSGPDWNALEPWEQQVYISAAKVVVRKSTWLASTVPTTTS